MEFQEVSTDEIRIMTGAMLGIGLDHSGDVYYILAISASDKAGQEQTITYAIPPKATDQFLEIVHAMEPVREQPL